MQLLKSFPDDYMEKLIQIMNKRSVNDSNYDLPQKGFYWVSEDTLLEFFNKYNDDAIIISVLELLSDDVITDRVFELLTQKLTGEMRSEVIILLGHFNLKDSQLLYLCKEELSFECYYTLGERLYKNPYISEKEFYEFMQFFSKSKFKDHIKYFCEDYLNRETSNIKENVIVEFIN